MVLHRWHGVGPMGGTDLDPILRNLGVTTVVPVGVSLNVAIPNLVMDAVNAAYRVVLPRDAVAGVPAAYGRAVIEHTLALLATVTTTADLLHAWRR
ncbi:Isochorismatase family protein YecD [Mycobacterium talmoniae]|uniref:Isochorismatase family protein YecD n=1 Tax=Mycobacterium talmoniae TaxID=1858794 RepID=A0A2S8BM11_9MYCO|nr:Isochorismatase family protein YecD [Mycobacterium talmoniae]